MTDENKKRKKRNIKKSRYNLEGIHTSKRKLEYFKKKRARQRATNSVFMLRSFVKFLLIIGIFYLCSKVMTAPFWYLPQNMFNTVENKNLKIIGNAITPANKILDALKKHPVPHKPLYLIGTTDYEKEIQKLSPVQKASVRRYIFPARFVVTIEEKIPIITIAPNPNAPEIAAITKDCSVISKEFLPINAKKYKTYKVLTYADYKTWTKTEILSLNLLAQRIEDFAGEKIVYIDTRNINDVYVQLETVKIRIGELNSTLKQRITRLSSIMPQIENLKRQTDYIDLRWDNSTYLKKKSKDAVHVIPSTDKKVQSKDKTETNKNNSVKVKEEKLKMNVSTSKPKPQTIDDIPKVNIQTVE